MLETLKPIVSRFALKYVIFFIQSIFMKYYIFLKSDLLWLCEQCLTPPTEGPNGNKISDFKHLMSKILLISTNVIFQSLLYLTSLKPPDIYHPTIIEVHGSVRVVTVAL